jgi:uridine kinase
MADDNGPASQKQPIEAILAEQFQLTKPGVTVDELLDVLTKAIKNLPTSDLRVVSLVGGVASGKSKLTAALIERLGTAGLKAESICTDDTSRYTRQQRWEMLKDPSITGLDLHDGDLLNEKINAIKQLSGDAVVKLPKYDPKTGDAVVVGEANFPHAIGQVDILVVEGDFDLVEQSDLLIYVDAPVAERRKIRIARDLNERTQVGDKTVTAEDIGASFDARHASQHVEFTEPTLSKADLVLKVDPRGEIWKYDIYRSRLPNRYLTVGRI